MEAKQAGVMRLVEEDNLRVMTVCRCEVDQKDTEVLMYDVS